MGKRILSMMAAFVLMICITGCGLSTYSSEKVTDLEYTVLKEQEIPQELMTQIEEQKESCFKLTYQDGEYLYIASGYGKQETGGYSIQVNELYLTSNTIYYKTGLFGPQKGETVHQAETYPYIVIKTEKREEPVVFE